jgi:hypothetical protein
MRDLRRPPGHPLVELAYDLRAAVDRALSDDAELAAPRAEVYRRLHETLRSVRRLVDALEQLVEGLEVQSKEVSGERPDNNVEGPSDDFQIIQISNQ